MLAVVALQFVEAMIREGSCSSFAKFVSQDASTTSQIIDSIAGDNSKWYMLYWDPEEFQSIPAKCAMASMKSFMDDRMFIDLVAFDPLLNVRASLGGTFSECKSWSKVLRCELNLFGFNLGRSYMMQTDDLLVRYSCS